MKYKANHLYVTVKNVEQSEKFYDLLMDALGFDVSKKYKGDLDFAEMRLVEYLSDGFDFGICSALPDFLEDEVVTRRPGALQHLAFCAESRAAVDEVFEKIKGTGARILHGQPQIYTKLGPDYYALFFEDPDGIRWEIFCNQAIGEDEE